MSVTKKTNTKIDQTTVVRGTRCNEIVHFISDHESESFNDY